ncbi:hypothetical protein K7X08_024212 [Anisodus acutangulus]|uniref:Uncharacterized protein n=1 Tax=Anisodus acutangulus TaxID=402998 RepID=A0A9Q1M7F6_9SOLA|nr:hypothetical protein K7X08_024212 [Anisodus acutangulus]
MSKEVVGQLDDTVKEKNITGVVPPPGRKFILNRLASEGPPKFSEDPNAVSLPELLYPIENLEQLFIATFTADIPWFLSYCEIPADLPVTITCHNTERCWSSSPDKRISKPYSDFPNLVVVYPPFPEVIAFGEIVAVLWSSNLVAGQWCRVTNTIWWQDFPRLDVPDYLSLFTPISEVGNNGHLISDFAAQLAGFMAYLVADVPSQAHWILELTNYDFRGSTGYLVASVPGVHSCHIPLISKPKHFLGGDCLPELCHFKSVGSVEASVAGLSHLFRTSVDLSGARMKKLATYLGNCGENVYGMSEVILKRDSNIPVDANAVSILIPNPENLSLGEFRKVEGSSTKVHLILHVSQGPSFSAISEVIRAEHVSAICSLIASLQRCWGIWQLQELLESRLSHFLPLHLEFRFWATAAGKQSSRFSESEESDPDWGCWSVSQELRTPSIRIIFPTIERVKNASSGILASRRILCFSQKTWHRLKTMRILHDAVPCPGYRIGYPMHVKVARRRIQSKKDASSFGWVYCGSHNFSEAAWGRPVSGLLDKKTNGNSSCSAKEADEWVQEEIPEEEEEVIEATGFVVKEKEDEKAYAEKLWSQVDSSENC